MRRSRITIASLLGIVAFVGVAFAALHDPTDTWDAILLGLTLLLLLASVLLAVHRSGALRAFWQGFSLFGWAYLLASVIPPIESRLPTTKALVLGRDMMSRPEDAEDYLTFTRPAANGVNPGASASPATTSPPNKWDVVVFNYPGTSAPTNYIRRLIVLPGETDGNFVRIGHSLFAMAFALLGGMISRRLCPGPGITKRPPSMATAGGSEKDDQGHPASRADEF
jgi:hypothetical protein